MIIYVLAATGVVLGLTLLIGLRRRHRTHPPVHLIMMAQHLWQPRKLD
jgi:hypothetical protein